MSGPDREARTNVGSWVSARAALHPDRIALHVEATGEELSYAALNRLANRIAHFLRGLGIRPGDRVALALRSEPLTLALYFAAAKVGAILVPLHTRLTPHELTFQLQDSEPSILLRDPAISVPSPRGVPTLTPAELRSLLPARDE